MQLVVPSIPDMTKGKDLGDFDPSSGLKVVGDKAGHMELPQEDPLFSWDYINHNKNSWHRLCENTTNY